MVAVPGVTATTDPVALTVATVAFEVVHATARPVSVLPPASRAVAVAAATAPPMSAPFPGNDPDLPGTGITQVTTAAVDRPTGAGIVPDPDLVRGGPPAVEVAATGAA